MDGAGRGGALDPIMAKLEEAEAAVETRVPFELLSGRLSREGRNKHANDHCYSSYSSETIKVIPVVSAAADGAGAARVAVGPGMTSPRRGRAHRPPPLRLEGPVAARLPHFEGHVVAAGGRGGVVEDGVAAVVQVLLFGLIWKGDGGEDEYKVHKKFQ